MQGSVFRWVVVIGTVCILCLAAVSGALAAGQTDVSVVPAESTVAVGETTTVEIVVESAQGGIGAYNVTLDTNIAVSIQNVSLAGDPGLREVSYSDDRTSVEVRAALMDTEDTGDVTILTVTLQGETDGVSPLALTVTEIGDEEGEQYEIGTVNSGQLTVGDGEPSPTASPTETETTDSTPTDTDTGGQPPDDTPTDTESGDQPPDDTPTESTTPTDTPTETETETPTPTGTPTQTTTEPATVTTTATPTPTASPSPSPTPSPTPSETRSPTVTTDLDDTSPTTTTSSSVFFDGFSPLSTLFVLVLLLGGIVASIRKDY